MIDDRLAGALSLHAVEAIADDAKAAAPMLVGHDPAFTELVGELVSAEGVEMKKGALATVDASRPLAPGSGTLRWLVPPALLGED